jgi:predicted RNA-binding Zn ribbon-like protein
VLRAGLGGASVGLVSRGFQPGGRAPAPPPLDLVQDFVNTEIPEWARDDIGTPELLTGWLRDRGLLRVDEEVDAAGFVSARALRTALRELALHNTLRGRPGTSERSQVDAALRPFALVVRLDQTGRLVPSPAGTGTDRALASLLAVVLEAQSGGEWSRLKACRKDTCGWLFYDASRNRTSSWCAMSICGNRAKTAAYRRRRGVGA